MDVVIMGGGLVGASLAACLARDPAVQVVVVEPADVGLTLYRDSCRLV